jgi:hypothetical protein
MEALEEITKLLSAEQRSGVMTCSCSAVDEKNFRISTPCLSLKHTKGSFSSQNRDQAEEYASALLARPLESLFDGQLESSFSIGRSLLENVFSSLAVLVDCRLHAYITFLTSRISSKEGEEVQGDSDYVESSRARRESESKLVNLIETGAQILEKRITTHFEVIDQEDDEVISIKGDTCLSMLRLEVSVDLEAPRYHGMSVSFGTTGKIKGEFV